MNYTATPEISLLDLTVRRWRLITLCFFIAIGLAGLATLLMPQKFESQMKLLVNNSRADLVVTPEKNATQMMMNEIKENEVNSEIELLRSHDILAAAVLSQRLYQPFQIHSSATPTARETERAILKLTHDLNVTNIRKTNVIQVSYRARTPEEAATVLTDISSRYLSAHVTAHSTPGSYRFFTDEVAKYREQLTAARTALTDFHRQNKVFVLPQQQAATVSSLQQAQAEMNNVGTEVAAQNSELEANADQLNKTTERVVTQIRQVPNQMASQQLQTMLTGLQNTRLTLLTKFKRTDRLVQEIEAQITNTQQALTEVTTNRAVEETTDMNSTHKELLGDYYRGVIKLKGLQSRKTALGAVSNQYVKNLNGLDTQSIELAGLEQQVREAEENYQLYVHRLEEAKLADVLDAGKFANVSIVEKPVISPIAVSPKLSLNLALGAALGLFLGLALAIAKEMKTGGGNVVTEPSRSGLRERPATATGD